MLPGLAPSKVRAQRLGELLLPVGGLGFRVRLGARHALGVRRSVPPVKAGSRGLGLHAAFGVGYSRASPFAAIAQW